LFQLSTLSLSAGFGLPHPQAKEPRKGEARIRD